MKQIAKIHFFVQNIRLGSIIDWCPNMSGRSRDLSHQMSSKTVSNQMDPFVELASYLNMISWYFPEIPYSFARAAKQSPRYLQIWNQSTLRQKSTEVLKSKHFETKVNWSLKIKTLAFQRPRRERQRHHSFDRNWCHAIHLRKIKKTFK